MKPRNWKQQNALALDMSVNPLCMADTNNPAEIDISAVTVWTKVPHL